MTMITKLQPAVNTAKMLVLTMVTTLAIFKTSSADSVLPSSLPSVAPSSHPSTATSVATTLSGVSTFLLASHPSSQPSTATSVATTVSGVLTFSSVPSNSIDELGEDNDDEDEDENDGYEDGFDLNPVSGPVTSGNSNPTYNPTAPPTTSTISSGDDIYSDIYSGGMNRPTFPTETPTLKPTVEYIPRKGDDPLAEETEPDVADFNDDPTFYHGLGDKLGKVGEYLDGVASPREMEKDKNVQVVGGILVVMFLLLLLVTAHMVMQYPDGLCAGCCRLTLKCMCCFIRTLCLPCRAICCKGSDQAQGRRTHAPMRTPFPTDLELA